MNDDNKNPRGRKPAPDAEIIDVQVNVTEVTESGAAAAIVGARYREVAERFAEGAAYDRNRLLDEAVFFKGQAELAALSLGKCLVQIKEHEPFGDFQEIVGRLGLGLRSAQRLMHAAVKYLSPALGGKSKALLQLGTTKLFDLMLEDDDDLAALAEGGTLAGLKLDAMQSMTTRELRAALTEARKDKAAKDKVIKDKGERIDALTEELHRRASSEPAEREAAQLELLRGDGLKAELALLRAVATIDTVMQEAATEAAELAARHTLDFLVQKLVDACLSRGITVDLAERVSPIWMAPINEAVAKGWGVEEAKKAAWAVKKEANA